MAMADKFIQINDSSNNVYPKINTPIVATALTGNKVGAGGSHGVGWAYDNQAIKFVVLQLLVDVNGTLSAGSTYNIKNDAVPWLPMSTLYFNMNRTDAGNAACTGKVNVNGIIQLSPLMSVPSGVQLQGTIGYFYQ